MSEEYSEPDGFLRQAGCSMSNITDMTYNTMNYLNVNATGVMVGYEHMPPCQYSSIEMQCLLYYTQLFIYHALSNYYLESWNNSLPRSC